MSHSGDNSQRGHRPVSSYPGGFHPGYSANPPNYPATSTTQQHIAYGQEPHMNLSQQNNHPTYDSSHGRPTSSNVRTGYSATTQTAPPQTPFIRAPQMTTPSHYPPHNHPTSNSGYGHVQPQAQGHVQPYSSATTPGGYGMYPSGSGHPQQTMSFSTSSPSGGDAYQQHDISGQYPASPQRPFPCDLCALSFNRLHDLKRHKETHSGEKPFECNGGCGKTFTRRDALKRHQQVKGCGTYED